MAVNNQRKYTKSLMVMLLAVPLLVFVSLKIGYTEITLADLLGIFFGQGSSKDRLIVLEFRLPRIVIAYLVGMGLSISGCILQGISKNPLADPGILGINAGAGLVVVVFVVLQGTLSIRSIFLLPFFALVGASLVGLIIYKLSTDPYRGVLPIRLVLNGIAIQAGINGLMMMIILKLDSDTHEFIALWQAGSIWKSNWQYVLILLPWIILGTLLACVKSYTLDLLSLKDESAIGVGVNLVRLKRQWLMISIALAAASVSVSGSIGFIGLLGPHISRQFVGNRHRYLIPASGLVGGALLVLADTLARKLIEPREVPTGIVVALLGAPYFIYLLFKASKKNTL